MPDISDLCEDHRKELRKIIVETLEENFPETYRLCDPEEKEIWIQKAMKNYLPKFLSLKGN